MKIITILISMFIISACSNNIVKPAESNQFTGTWTQINSKTSLITTLTFIKTDSFINTTTTITNTINGTYTYTDSTITLTSDQAKYPVFNYNIINDTLLLYRNITYIETEPAKYDTITFIKTAQ